MRIDEIMHKTGLQELEIRKWLTDQEDKYHCFRLSTTPSFISNTCA